MGYLGDDPEGTASLSCLFSNRLLIIAFSSMVAAQVVKCIYGSIRARRFRPGALIKPGGMPSSHTALVAALTRAVAESKGWGSAECAISIVLTVVVMYDAQGVRRAASQHAKLLNEIVNHFLYDDSFPSGTGSSNGSNGDRSSNGNGSSVHERERPLSPGSSYEVYVDFENPSSTLHATPSIVQGSRRLNEILGHTPSEVIAGFFFGFFYASLLLLFFKEDPRC